MKFKNKKVISAMICLFVTLILSINNMCYANINDNEIININETKKQAIETVSKNIENLKLNSRIGLIFDRNSKRILYEKNGLKQVPMASTTKIMTAIVVLENSELNDVVTISNKAAGTGGARLGLRTNDKITVHDLLYGLMLKSGNDAAVALAEHVGGGIEEFADMMNKKAKELGLINSHFITPHGLDKEKHYTTAYELACMADYALKIPKFKEIVSSKNYNITKENKIFIANFYKYGFVGIMLDWIDKGMQEDYHKIVMMMGTVLDGNIARSIENFKQK